MDGSELSASDKGDEKAPETEGKIKRSLKSMIKQMQLSEEEMKYRMDNFDDVDVVKEYLKYLKCTKCSVNFQQLIKKGDSVGVHPLLGVLMCDSCCDYYGDGNFSLDSEGEDKYCRWCGEGGTIFACSKCICGFCDMCIKKHFGEKGLEEVEKDDDWICYFCNPQPLWYLRSICSLAKEAAKNKRENLKKSKEGTNVKKKRRKKENIENDLSGTSSESSVISSKSDDESPCKRKRKRKRFKRPTEKLRRDESSSSEDEKENHVSSKKRAVRSRKQVFEGDEDEDTDTKGSKKKSKVIEEENEFESKSKLILEKFKSIWKLTQTITEVGLSSSRAKIKHLSKSRCNTLDLLRKEHEDLKSCMKVLVSSLNTASNSVNSIKEDLTFDTTDDDTESFRSQEIKLKRLAEKFHEESDDHTSVNSEGDSFGKEIKKKEGRKKESVKGTRKSEAVKKGNRESDKNSEDEKNSGGVNKSKSLFSGSGSDEGEKKEKSVERSEEEEMRNGEQGSDDSDKSSAAVKPFLKVKSFARMLEENAYDKNKDKEEKVPIVIDLVIDSDENENENKKKGSPNGKGEKAGNRVSSETEKKSPSKGHKNQTDSANEEDEGIPTKENEIDNSTNDKENEQSSCESEAGMNSGVKRNKRKGKSSASSDSEREGETRKGGTRRNRKMDKKQKSSDSESGGETKKARTKRGRKKGKKQKPSDSESEAETKMGRRKRNRKNKKQNSSESGSESSENDNGKSSGEKEKKTAAGKKKETSVRENEGNSSENEKSQFSDDDKEEEKEVESTEEMERKTEEQTSSSKSHSKETTESEDEKEKQQSEDEERDKEASSEGESNKNREFNSTTDGDDDDCDNNEDTNDDDNCEKAKKKRNEDENDKSEGESESKDSPSVESPEKKEASKTSDNEKGSRRDSSDSGDPGKSPSKDKKTDSSDSDSKSSIGKEKNTRGTRDRKKPFKGLFEKFKRKRERFLKMNRENSQPENEEEKPNVSKALDSSESENETKTNEKKSGRRKNRRILASSDEESEGGGEKTKNTTSSEESEKENQKSDSEEAKPSSGSESSSDEEIPKKARRRIRKRQKGSSDSSEEENKKKRKRKESSDDSSEDEKTEKKKKGRRNIKKILKKDSLEVETKEALKNEEERKKRLKERQKLFEELFPEEGEQGAPKKLILDFNPETKEPLVTVHKKLLKNLKPHQVKGVKFMWDSCFESVEKLEEDSGSGCILAHCMGLGKTLQVITLVHTVMTHDLGVNTVLIVCPLSTVSNWIREFEMWLANVKTDPIMLYDLVKYKRPEERLFHLEDWHENGGVLVLSYDLFRTLTKIPPKTGKKVEKRKRKNQPRFEKALIDPGPDLVICDEGHLLKNEDTALSKCVTRMKTSRRIVLTGTPLQNNLIEYHCMVQFVKPNILGTKKEFCNRFVNPINNGQFEDSTELDVKIMKKRSHVLHSMLDGCIQRFDYSVLTPFLPEKHEYVLSVALTDTQVKLYSHFLQNFSARVGGSSRSASLFNDYHQLQRIWTHPRAMLMQSDKAEAQKELLSDSEGSLKDFVVSGSEESETPESSDDSVEEVVPKKRLLRSNANDPEVQKALEEEEKAQNKHWWDEFYDEKAYDDLRESNKLIILFSLLKHCARKKDKLLVFSQSLYSLDLIEYFLAKVDENNKKDEETLCGHRDNWILGTDYFRLDGSTSSEMRDRWCKVFNKESNTRARLFLISTRAGGLGINLYSANRVVIFDASWNPSHDLQSIFRVYRFGQKKACFVYRFLSEATMEEKIYERQVTKLSLAHRVVDEHQIGRHYTMGNLQELYAFQPTPKEQRKVPNLPKDDVLADILAEHKDIVVGYHEHDSLLENKQEEELTEEERKAAWKEYEEEKAQKTLSSTVMELSNEQLMFLQQLQFQQGTGPGSVMQQQFINPAALNQINSGMQGVNLMHSNIPLEFLQRGVRLGVIPLTNESLDSYIVRILNREAWMKGGVAQG